MATIPATPAPTSFTIDSVANPLVSVANNLRTQTRDRGAHAWRFSLTYASYTRATVAPLLAFLWSQAGRNGTFELDLSQYGQGSQGTGIAVVNGGSQTGNSLVYDTAAASQTIFAAGDLFYIFAASRPKLYMVTADSVSNGSGEGTVEFFPALRASPVDNTGIVASAPQATVRLESNTLPVDVDVCLRYGQFSFSMVEALN